MESNPNNAMKSIVSQLTLAGAAALCGTVAQAQIQYTDLSSSNVNVGFAPGDSSLYKISLPGQSLSFFTAVNPTHHYINFRSNGGNADIRASTLALVNNAGQTWSTLGGSTANQGEVAVANHAQSTTSFTNKYLAFVFYDTTTNQTDYGWVEASLTSGFGNLNLNITGYAYDPSGNKIAMGDKGAAPSVPEPAPAVVLAAFSALALGAVGVKRLKALQN